MKVFTILIRSMWAKIVKLLFVILHLFQGIMNLCCSFIEWANLIFIIWNISYGLYFYIKQLIFNVKYVNLQNTNVIHSQMFHINHPNLLCNSRRCLGRSHSPTHTHSKWFIMFTDDHTRIFWVYLFKEKTKVQDIFINFHDGTDAISNTNPNS